MTKAASVAFTSSCPAGVLVTSCSATTPGTARAQSSMELNTLATMLPRNAHRVSLGVTKSGRKYSE